MRQPPTSRKTASACHAQRGADKMRRSGEAHRHARRGMGALDECRRSPVRRLLPGHRVHHVRGDGEGQSSGQVTDIPGDDGFDIPRRSSLVNRGQKHGVRYPSVPAVCASIAQVWFCIKKACEALPGSEQECEQIRQKRRFLWVPGKRRALENLKNTGKTQMVRIGIVGVGFMGMIHFLAARKLAQRAGDSCL